MTVTGSFDTSLFSGGVIVVPQTWLKERIIFTQNVFLVHAQTMYLKLTTCIETTGFLIDNSLQTTDVSPCSSPLRDFSRGGTSATQREKFHTDDVNQCLHNKCGSHGVPNANLFNFTFLLVDFGKVLCSSANELQQNSNASSREDYIPQILTVLLEIHRIYI